MSTELSPVCSRCKEHPAQELHLCPFDCELLDDCSDQCDCCLECEKECERAV